jgi:hypothetical protein
MRKAYSPYAYALSIFRLVEQARQSRAGLALHGLQRDHWLHAVAVAVLAQRFAVVAFIYKQPL